MAKKLRWSFLRRSAAVAVMTGGLLALGAGVAAAGEDGEQPPSERAPVATLVGVVDDNVSPAVETVNDLSRTVTEKSAEASTPSTAAKQPQAQQDAEKGNAPPGGAAAKASGKASEPVSKKKATEPTGHAKSGGSDPAVQTSTAEETAGSGTADQSGAAPAAVDESFGDSSTVATAVSQVVPAASDSSTTKVATDDATAKDASSVPLGGAELEGRPVATGSDTTTIETTDSAGHSTPIDGSSDPSAAVLGLASAFGTAPAGNAPLGTAPAGTESTEPLPIPVVDSAVRTALAGGSPNDRYTIQGGKSPLGAVTDPAGAGTPLHTVAADLTNGGPMAVVNHVMTGGSPTDGLGLGTDPLSEIGRAHV